MNVKPSDFLSKDEKNSINEAIKAAELNTSGEIRLHIETTCPENVLDRAAYIFSQLKMHKTQQRNGVLFYLSITDRKFAILGDAGINSKVPKGFWNSTTEHILEFFKEGKIALGLESGILMAGEQLKTHFPFQTNDVNELSDEISFGK